MLLFSIKTKKLCSLTIVFLSIYIGTHVFLGKQVTEYFSPSSLDMKSCNIRLLNSPDISEDKKAYLKNDLRYVNIDSIADYHESMFVDKGPWKKAKKGLFHNLIIQRFADENKKD